MKRLALLVLPILLTGCLEDKGAVYAKCVMSYNDMRINHDNQWMHVWEGPSDYMITCMRAEGYELDTNNCKTNKFIYQELSCYHQP